MTPAEKGLHTGVALVDHHLRAVSLAALIDEADEAEIRALSERCRAWMDGAPLGETRPARREKVRRQRRRTCWRVSLLDAPDLLVLILVAVLRIVAVVLATIGVDIVLGDEVHAGDVAARLLIREGARLSSSMTCQPCM